METALTPVFCLPAGEWAQGAWPFFTEKRVREAIQPTEFGSDDFA